MMRIKNGNPNWKIRREKDQKVPLSNPLIKIWKGEKVIYMNYDM